MKAYKLTTRRYERSTPNTKWTLTEEEHDLMTYEWGEELCSKQELNFWRNIGYCRHSRTHSGHTVTRISPSKTNKTVETFEVCSIDSHQMGNREREIINQCPRTLGHLVESSKDHEVYEIGLNDRVCYYDFKTSQFVG